jgi:homospermidine synthase
MVIRHGEAFSLSDNLAIWADADNDKVNPNDDPTLLQDEVISAEEIDHWSLDFDNKKCVYRPTVHYAYCCADAAWNSIHELAMRDYEPQARLRCMNDDIVSGTDELGCLLMGHDYNA